MKKVLSWVLVLALVLSSFTMAFAGDTANSSDMKDAAAIANVEAVDVMVATGIIGGYPDGYYYPEKAVTRAEMAKMISVAVNGGEDVGAYYADSCTFADSVNHWAAGYIAYCANEGIIDGRDANTFDPDATVTGLEAAKMMLVALGYDSKIEKFVGDQWAGNVLKAAKAEELFDGCDDFTPGAALNRDNAAQVIFNGLNAVGVYYDYDATISTGDTTITVNTAAQDQSDALYVLAFTDPVLAYEDGAGYNADDFGRAAHGWSLDGEEIGVYAAEADVTFVSSVAGTVAEAIAEDYDDEWADDNEVVGTTKYNGGTFTSVGIGDVVELFDLDTAAAGDAAKADFNAIVINYEPAVITEVDTDVDEDDAEDGVSAYVYVDGTKYFDTDIPGYDATTYVEEAVIAVAFNATTILDSFVPEKFTGSVEYDHTTAYTIDGTKYTLHGDFTAVDSSTPVAGDNEYDFYLVNGYLFASELVVETVDTLFGLAYDKGTETGVYDAVEHFKLIDADAAEVDYTVDADATAALAAISGSSVDGTVANVALTAYQLNEDGEVDAVAIAANGLDLTYAYTASAKTMSSKGVFDGKYVADDVVIFFNEGDAADPEWAIYGYEDLAAVEDVEAVYFVDEDGEIVAMYVTAGFEAATSDVIGFFVETVDTWTDADSNAYATITVLVDGKEVDYTGQTTVAGSIIAKDIVKVEVKADGSMKAVTELVKATDADQIVDGQLVDAFTGDNVYAYYEAAATKAGSGEAVTTADGVQVVDKVYKETAEGFEVVKASKIANAANLVFYQFADDAEVWNVVVIKAI